MREKEIPEKKMTINDVAKTYNIAIIIPEVKELVELPFFIPVCTG